MPIEDSPHDVPGNWFRGAILMLKTNVTAAVLVDHSGKLKLLDDIQIPEITQGQVLVKVLYTGLCHSQLMEIDGKRGPDPYPHCLGHEGGRCS